MVLKLLTDLIKGIPKMNTPQLGILEIETLLKVAKFRNEKARKSLDHSINLRLTT